MMDAIVIFSNFLSGGVLIATLANMGIAFDEQEMRAGLWFLFLTVFVIWTVVLVNTLAHSAGVF